MKTLALIVALALSGCAGISELGAGANYDPKTGAIGGQVVVKLARSQGYKK